MISECRAAMGLGPIGVAGCRRWRSPGAGLALGLALLTAGLVPLSAADAAEGDRMQRSVTVSATGSVNAVPDIARISSGVVTEAVTAREALSANTTLVRKLTDALKEAGVAAADMQTSSITVSPRYTHNTEGRAPRIDGYSVSNDLSVVVRDLTRLGDILDSLVSLGANQIGGLSFDIANPAALRDTARKQAVDLARKRAELYAEAAGAKVGEVLTITEGGATHIPREHGFARAALADGVPIERGSQQVEVNVTATWALK